MPIVIGPKFEARRPAPIVIEPTKKREHAPIPVSESSISTPLSRLCQSPLPSPKKVDDSKLQQSSPSNNRLSPGELSLFNTLVSPRGDIRPGYSPTDALSPNPSP